MAVFGVLCAALAVVDEGNFGHVLGAGDDLHDVHVRLAKAEAEVVALRAELQAVRRSAASSSAATSSELIVGSSGSSIQDAHDVMTSASQNLHLFPMLAGSLKLGLFQHLQASDGSTFDEMQAALNVSAKGLDALLDALLAAGMLTYDAPTTTFHNHDSMKSADWDSWKVAFLGLAVSMQRQFYFIPESVREGRAVGLQRVFGDYPSLYEARAAIPELAAYWDKWMQQQDGVQKFDRITSLMRHTRGVLSRNAMHAGEPLFRGHVLDWCGNTGGNAMIMAKRDPTLNVTVLDLPTQTAKARTNVAQAGLSAQVDTLSVDLLGASLRLPAKYDAVTMIHTIREWSGEHLQRFFRHIHAALKPDGFVLLDMLAKHAVGQHFETVKGGTNIGRTALYFLVSAANEQYKHTPDELEGMLRSAGFAEFLHQDGYLMATKAA